MRTHQCPRCELRFRYEPEVRAHLTDDHGMSPEQLEHHLPGWRARERSKSDDPDLVNPRGGHSHAEPAGGAGNAEGA